VRRWLRLAFPGLLAVVTPMATSLLAITLEKAVVGRPHVQIGS
jgi:hypothetical protein